VLQLFASRGGKLTIYSQRSPKVVRSLLGGVRLSAPALVCGGVLAYNFAEGTGTALCSFAGMEESVLRVLPSVPGVGIALQMKNGSTRVLRMSESLEAHLRQEWTTFVLSNAADVRGAAHPVLSGQKAGAPDGAAGKGAGRGHRDPPR
jgi:hypothetical protein